MAHDRILNAVTERSRSMRHCRWLAALGALALLSSAASAQTYPRYDLPPPYWVQPGTGWKAGNNPDMTGPGTYFVTPGGLVTGPHYWVNPPWGPETGYRPGPQQCKRPVQGCPPPPMGLPTVDSFPSHQYIRSPRDFFMFHENLEVERSRELRPVIVP
jgi:hypothetical protein